jgi:hypothetical protein
MSNGTLADQVAALRIIACLEETIESHNLWTRFLKGNPKPGRQDREAILELAERINKLLTAVPNATLAVEKIAKRNAKKLLEDRDFVQAAPVEERGKIKGWTESKAGFAGALRSYAVTIRRAIPAERKLLKLRQRSVAKGSQTIAAPADVFTHEFICSICKAVIILSILTDNEKAYRWAYAQAAASAC